MGIKKLHMTKLFEDEVYTKRGSLFFCLLQKSSFNEKSIGQMKLELIKEWALNC